MSRRRNNRKRSGLTTLEYSLLLLSIVLALVAVQTTLRRAISFKWRDAADSAFGSGRQYEPGVTTVTGS